MLVLMLVLIVARGVVIQVVSDFAKTRHVSKDIEQGGTIVLDTFAVTRL